jgi:hypothetical protein
MCLVLRHAITQVTLKLFGDPDSVLLVYCSFELRADVQRVPIGDNDSVICLIAFHFWRRSSTQSNRSPDERIGSQVRGQFVPCTTCGLLAESVEPIQSAKNTEVTHVEWTANGGVPGKVILIDVSGNVVTCGSALELVLFDIHCTGWCHRGRLD